MQQESIRGCSLFPDSLVAKKPYRFHSLIMLFLLTAPADGAVSAHLDDHEETPEVLITS